MNQSNLVSRILRVPLVLFREPLYVYYKVKCLVLSHIYQRFILPIKVRRVRKKNVIDVLFVLNELGCWKTETLYQKMLEHPRFRTKLLLVPAKETPDAIDILKSYLDSKGYIYDVISDNGKDMTKLFSSDIIFYQKPYEGVMENKYFYLYHLDWEKAFL